MLGPEVAGLVALTDEGRWEGTATELRGALLSAKVDPRAVPQEPRAVSALLKRSTPKLEALGIAVSKVGQRRHRLERVHEEAS